MKCIHCGRGLAHGVTLMRQNQKGVPGVWACEECNKLPVPDDVAELVAVIQNAGSNPTKQ